MGRRLTSYTCSSIIAVCVICTSCTVHDPKEIIYSTPVAGDTAVLFLANVVNTDSLEFNAAFSCDGHSFFFSRKIDVISRIFVSHYRQHTWTKPVPLSFHLSEFSDADPAIGDDGILYFISDRPKDAQDTLRDYDIWFSNLTADGSWSEAKPMTIVNSDSNEFYISFANNGNLYFASSRGRCGAGRYLLQSVH